MMTPMRTLTKYNLDLLDVIDDEKKLLNFLRMEKWIADRPHHPGEAAKQWLKDLYQDNKLVERRVRARRAHGRSRATSRCRCSTSSPRTTTSSRRRPRRRSARSRHQGLSASSPLPGGHVGVFVGGKSQGCSAPGIAEWLAEHDE